MFRWKAGLLLPARSFPLATTSRSRRLVCGIEMTPSMLVFGVGAIASFAAVLGWKIVGSSANEEVFEAKTKPSQAAPMCPWREPESDLKKLFGSGAHYILKPNILSIF